MVWEGKRSYRNDLVTSVAGLKTVAQPVYSAELNSAENVFEEIRRRVEGRVYVGLQEKMAAVEECLNRPESDPDGVKSLVS